MSTDRQAGTPQSLVLLLGSCLPILGAVLLAPLLPRIQSHFSDTPGVSILVPIALTIPALFVALLSPFAGFISDRLGRKPLLLASMVLYSLCGLLPLWLESLEAIVLSRAGLGLAEAGIMTCCTTLMGDYYQGDRRERLFALQVVVTSLSATLFSALGGLMGQDNWRFPFVLYAAGLLLFPVMASLLWEPRPNEREARSVAAEVFPWGSLMPLYVLSFLAGISLFIVPVQAGYLLTQLHTDTPQQVAFMMIANQFGALLGAMSFRLLGRIRHSNLLLLSFVLVGSGGLMMVKAQSYELMTVAVLINGLGLGLMLPTLLTWIMSQIGFAQRGRATGGFMTAVFAGEFISPLVVLSLTGGNPHDLPSALVLLAIIQLVLAVGCLALPRLVRPLAAPTTTVF
jgi:MFS family permease